MTGNNVLDAVKSAVVHGLDGAGRFVDQKTNGKYTSVINTGVGKAKEMLGQPQQAQPEQQAQPDQQTQPEQQAEPERPQQPGHDRPQQEPPSRGEGS